jgi:uncharacterized SAM-binding protein YcdF (DUF218 family)
MAATPGPGILGSRRLRRPRWTRRRWWLVGAALAVLLAVSSGAYRLYVAPQIDPVSTRDPADAILALGGDSRAAEDAYRLAQTGVARMVVLSDPYPPPSQLEGICTRNPGTVPVLCFHPDPSTTQGEAEELRALVAARGWHHVIVMAPTFHISRARLIVRRCFTGQLEMVPVPESYPLGYWLYHVGYQTAGFAKALLVTRGC